MNISALPTDNLYKFIALFGLAVFFSSFFLVTDDDLENRDKTGTEYVLANELKKFNQVEYDIIKKYTDSIFDIHEDLVGSAEYTEELLLKHQNEDIENMQVVSNKYQKLIKSKRALWEKEFNSNFFINLIKYKNKQSSFLLTFGGVLMIIGFSLWYFKLQRYIDAQKAVEGQVYINKLKETPNQPTIEDS
ncbi:MAG: hypothetical protein KAJ28_05675 [Flavobacteriaceae bacterium]|nr:hypothetical protein [Flavobacteriaceae bacterium]